MAAPLAPTRHEIDIGCASAGKNESSNPVDVLRHEIADMKTPLPRSRRRLRS